MRKTLHYPNGLYFLEPLYAVLKSLLILSLLIITVIGTGQTAYVYFSTGMGETMNTAPVLPYTIAMAILCFGLSIYNRRQNKRINESSTMLLIKAQTNFIDGLQSAGIGVAVILLNFIDIDGKLGFLHYTADFFITLILVLFSVKQPVIGLVTAFQELTGGTTNNQKVKKTISYTIEKHFNGIAGNLKYDIFKIGMKIKVCIYLSDGADAIKLTQAREQSIAELKPFYESIEINYCY